MQLNKFNISVGQIRKNDFIHNGGWYDKNCNKIGWGDLSISDLNCIKNSLEKDEMFIVLGEQESFWDFVSWEGNKTIIDSKERNPNIKYIKENAKFIIVFGKIYNKNRYSKGLQSFTYHDEVTDIECIESFDVIL